MSFRSYTMEDIYEWDSRIYTVIENLGIDCFPMEFEVCDHFDMLNYITYTGMPSHYPHWSYGKTYEKQKTLYDYGLSNLPYELVINSNPCLAYLMKENSLLLQILTVAHVYGHNDFFKNNFTFKFTRPEYTIETFKTHAKTVHQLQSDPSVGVDRVEQILDAAHALSLNRNRNMAIRKLTPNEQKRRAWEGAQIKRGEHDSIRPKPEYKDVDLTKIPLQPDEDLLLFIRDHNPFLEEWQKELLTIVDEEARYFIPQIETKILNEGWASLIHHKVLNTLELPQDLHLEFLVRHNQVITPHPGGLNPYHVGFTMLQEIEKKDGMPALLRIRESDRDASFVRQYLTPEIAKDLNLFQHDKVGSNRKVTEISDPDGFETIRNTLIKNVGTGSIPVIKVEDANFSNQRELYLKHDHDGRDLELEYAERTLAFVHKLWHYPVVLETRLQGKKHTLHYREATMQVKEVPA